MAVGPQLQPTVATQNIPFYYYYYFVIIIIVVIYGTGV
jgi:hypothetical protein